MTSSPTLDDVAQLSKTSRATVSRVINGQPGVRATTEQRIRQAIQSLKYKPHQTARALATGQSALIALIMPRRVFFNADLFPLRAIELIHSVVSRAKYAVQLCILDDEFDGDALESYLSDLHGFNGLVFITYLAPAMLNCWLENAAIPYALIEHKGLKQRASHSQIMTKLEHLLKQVMENGRSPVRHDPANGKPRR